METSGVLELDGLVRDPGQIFHRIGRLEQPGVYLLHELYFAVHLDAL